MPEISHFADEDTYNFVKKRTKRNFEFFLLPFRLDVLSLKFVKDNKTTSKTFFKSASYIFSIDE